MEGQSDLPENALRSGGKRLSGSSASPTDERPPKRSRVEAAGGPDSESDYGSDFDEETIAQLDAAVEALSSANQKETAAQDDETDYGSDFDEETIAQLDVAIAKIKARRLPAADTDNRKRPRAGSLGAGSDEEGHRQVKRLRAAQAPVLESDDGSESELEIIVPQALDPAPAPRPRTPARPSGQNPAEEDAWRQEHEGLLFVTRRPTEEERRRRKAVELKVLTGSQFRDLYKVEPQLGEAALARSPDGDYRPNDDHGAGSEALKNSRAELKSLALGEVGMFVRDHGRFRVINPSDTLPMGNGLRDWTGTYGGDNVWLKTRDGFRTVENLHAMSLGSDGADMAYFSVNIRPLRRDLAQVFVQDDRKGERYVSLEKHRQRLTPGGQQVHPAMLQRFLGGRDAFVLSPDGWALMKPLDFEGFGWKPYFEAAVPDSDLRNSLRGAQMIANGEPSRLTATTEPDVIVAIDKDTLLRGRAARDHIRHQGLPGMANLFYRTNTSFGERGMFSCAAAPTERYGTTIKPDRQLLAELKIDAGSSRTNQRPDVARSEASRPRERGRDEERGGYGM